MSNEAGLASTAAVQSQGRSYLFYSKPEGNLGFLKSQTAEEDSATETDTPPYEKEDIILEGTRALKANSKSPQITAVAYTLNGRDEIRVYYISAEGYLQELCRSGDGLWKLGSLNKAKQAASPKSLLEASIDYTQKGYLKLYYNRSDSSAIWCTWVELGKQSWSAREISKDL